jgi:hypothetical protein
LRDHFVQALRVADDALDARFGVLARQREEFLDVLDEATALAPSTPWASAALAVARLSFSSFSALSIAIAAIFVA